MLSRRSAEQGARAWFLRDPHQPWNPHPRLDECRGRGKLRAPPGGQAAESKAIPVTAPPGTGLSGFLFGEKNPRNLAKQKGGKSGPGAAGGTLARVSLPWPDPHASARAVPAAGAREGSRAGRLCAPINLPGGRRAGGLGAVCNFAASVAAVPGERAPALAPIGHRRVSWCDLLLSLLAFGHPETNQFDDY